MALKLHQKYICKIKIWFQNKKHEIDMKSKIMLCLYMVEVLYFIHVNNIITIPNTHHWYCVIVQSPSPLKEPYERKLAKKKSSCKWKQ
jgi:hypothetical protein